MLMFSFLWDFIRYPFDSHKETNKFGRLLLVIFKQYPALFWVKPTWKKIVSLPLLVVYYIFKK